MLMIIMSIYAKAAEIKGRHLFLLVETDTFTPAPPSAFIAALCLLIRISPSSGQG